MLVKLTDHCLMGCSHCMEDSTGRGEHMSLDTFQQVIRFTLDIESAAQALGYRAMLLSGGECTDNPNFLEMLSMVEAAGLAPVIITHGLWINGPLHRHILRPGRKVFVQVTNDDRLYPRRPPVIDDPRVAYVSQVTQITRLGRAAGKTFPIPDQRTPGSFNFRSMTRSLGIKPAIAQLRMRALAGKGGHCSPSVTREGYFMAGETRNCHKLGTVWDAPEVLEQAVLRMGSCNRCGLESNLQPEHRRAIGI